MKLTKFRAYSISFTYQDPHLGLFWGFVETLLKALFLLARGDDIAIARVGLLPPDR